MPYELHVNAAVSGQPSLDSLTGAVDKATASQQRIAAAIQGHIAANTSLSNMQAKLALQEVQLEQLREKHRMAQEGLTAATLRGATAQNALAGGMQRTAGSAMAASSALRVMEGAMPLRAAASFLGSLQGIGAAMQMAFPIFGAIALIEVFGRIATGAQKFIKDLEEGPTRIQQRFRELNATFQLSNDELRLANDRIADNIAKLEHKPRNLLAEALDEARVNADKLAVSLSRDLDRVEELIKKNAVGLPAQLMGRAGTGDIETGYEAYKRHVDDINYKGNLAVHAAKSKDEAAAAQKTWDAALAGERNAYQQGIRSQIGLATAPQILRYGTGPDIVEPPSNLNLERIAMLQGIDTNLSAQGDAATLRTRAAALEGELPIARASAEIARKTAEEAKRQATARLHLTRRTDRWMDEQAKKAEEMLDREGKEITKESAKVGHEQLKEAMKEAGFDIARFFPHELGPLTGRETIPQFSARAAHQERMMAITSRPGQEAGLAAREANARLDAINTIRDRELAILDTTRDAAKIADIRNKTDLEAAQVRYTFEEKIAELQRKQKEELVSIVSGLAMAAQHGGAAGFIKGQLEGMESKVITNVARMAIDSPTGKSITDKMHAGEGSIFGKLLQGTPFGPDPLKAATEANTLATIANTTALQAGGGGVGGANRLAIPGFGGFGAAANSGIEGGMPAGYEQPSMADGGGSYDAIVGGVGVSAAGKRGGMTIGRGIGYAAAGTAAAFGAYSGFKSGGAQGALAGTGALLGAASLIPGPQQPFIMAAAMATTLIASVLGDPKQRREAEIQRELKYNQYMAPVAINASMTTGGTYADFDRFGQSRGSSLSPFPTVSQGFFDYRHNVTVPGRVDSSFGGAGGGPPITINVQTIDSRSFNENSHLVADALQHALQTGRGTGLQETLRHL